MATKTVSKKEAQVSIQDKFVMMREDMGRSLIEREVEIDIVLTSLICREHPLFVGPPGTGKSLLCDSILRWIDGDVSKYQVLFNKHTAMEEVFGPIDVAGLKASEYRRITKNKLPEAHVAFADEIWKGSSSILNAMLKIMNERKFDNGSGLQSCPLRVCVAASNEWPDAELSALFDRFLFRKIVKPVSRSARDRLLWTRDHSPSFRTSITLAELDLAWEEAETLEFTDRCKSALDKILDELHREGIRPGDRRMYKAINAAQAYAYLCGAHEVDAEHLEILSHVLWDDPSEQPQKTLSIVMRIASPEVAEVQDLLAQALDVVEKNSPVQAVPKLQEIQTRLKSLRHPKAKTSVVYLQTLIKSLYQKVIGE